jgi:hypothetical protein
MTANLLLCVLPCDAFFHFLLLFFLDINYYPIIVPFIDAFLIIVISIHSYPLLLPRHSTFQTHSSFRQYTTVQRSFFLTFDGHIILFPYSSLSYFFFSLSYFSPHFHCLSRRLYSDITSSFPVSYSFSLFSDVNLSLLEYDEIGSIEFIDAMEYFPLFIYFAVSPLSPSYPLSCLYRHPSLRFQYHHNSYTLIFFTLIFILILCTVQPLY